MVTHKYIPLHACIQTYIHLHASTNNQPYFEGEGMSKFVNKPIILSHPNEWRKFHQLSSHIQLT